MKNNTDVAKKWYPLILGFGFFAIGSLVVIMIYLIGMVAYQSVHKKEMPMQTYKVVYINGETDTVVGNLVTFEGEHDAIIHPQGGIARDVKRVIMIPDGH